MANLSSLEEEEEEEEEEKEDVESGEGMEVWDGELSGEGEGEEDGESEWMLTASTCHQDVRGQNLWMHSDFIQSPPPACCLQGECEERRWPGQGFHGGTSPPRIHNRTWQSPSRPPSWPRIDKKITHHYKLTESVLPPGIKPTLIPGRGTVIFLDNIKSDKKFPFKLPQGVNGEKIFSPFTRESSWYSKKYLTTFFLLLPIIQVNPRIFGCAV